MVHLILLQTDTYASVEPLRVTEPPTSAIQDMFCQGFQASDVCPLDTGQGVRLFVDVSIVLTALFSDSCNVTDQWYSSWIHVAK